MKIIHPDGLPTGHWHILQRHLAGGQEGLHHVEVQQGVAGPPGAGALPRVQH